MASQPMWEDRPPVRLGFRPADRGSGQQSQERQHPPPPLLSQLCVVGWQPGVHWGDPGR